VPSVPQDPPAPLVQPDLPVRLVQQDPLVRLVQPDLLVPSVPQDLPDLRDLQDRWAQRAPRGTQALPDHKVQPGQSDRRETPARSDHKVKWVRQGHQDRLGR
jgi:hypothetical protein